MSFGFQEVPNTVLTPGEHVEISNTRAVQGTPARPARTLLIGIRLAAGSVLENTLVSVGSKDDGEAFFVRGSMLSEMINRNKDQDPQGELFAIALDAAGTPSTGTHVFAGAATENGTIFLYIGSKRIEVSVASGDSASDVGDAIDAALLLPENTDAVVDSANTAGSVAYTVKWDGTSGDELRITLNAQDGENLPAGITVVPTDFDVIMSGGATDPDITTATAALGSEAFQFIGSGLNDATNMVALQTFLAGRFDAMVQLDGISVVGFNSTQALTTTKGNANNSQFMSILAGGEAISPPWDYAASGAAVERKRYAVDPARPMQTTKLVGIRGPLSADEFTRAERDILLADGIATTKTVVGAVTIDRFRTTYQLNGAGVPDPSFADVNTLMNLIAQRNDIKTLFALRFPNHKLAIDGTLANPGQPIVTPLIAKSVILGLYRSWELQGLVQDFAGFKNDLRAQINANDPNRLDVLLAPRLIGQLRVSAFLLQFILGVPAEAA